MKRWRPYSSDQGSAPLQFVVALPIFVLISVTIIQLVLVLHIKATLTEAATEGARAAALAGSSPARGVARVNAALAGDISRSAVSSVTIRPRTISGTQLLETTIQARIPIMGVLGTVNLVVRGHALAER